jgi:hypothetical protein
MAKKRESDAETTGERLDDTPTDQRADKPTSRKREPKVKSTYYLPSKLKRLIKVVASDLGMDASQLVTKLLSQQLRGVSRPTIPADMRRHSAQDMESAA